MIKKLEGAKTFKEIFHLYIGELTDADKEMSFEKYIAKHPRLEPGGRGATWVRLA